MNPRPRPGRQQQGPVAKLFGWLLLALSLGAFAMANYYAFTKPGSWRGSGGDVRVGMFVIDVLMFGGLFLMYRFGRKHERAMRDAGFEPGEIGETYWEAYFLRSKAEATRRGGDFRDNMRLDLTKRLVGLDSARVLSAAEIRAAVRQASPLPGASPPGDLLGTWTSPLEASPRPGWTAQVALREAAGSCTANLWVWAAAGVRDEGESAASVREGFVEVKREGGSEVRVVRLTPGSAPDCVDVNEYRFPAGKPRNMQANSCVLRKIKA